MSGQGTGRKMDMPDSDRIIQLLLLITTHQVDLLLRFKWYYPHIYTEVVDADEAKQIMDDYKNMLNLRRKEKI